MRFRPHNHRILYGTCMLTPLLQRLPAPARPFLLPALLFVSLIALAELSRLFTLNNIVISAIWPISGPFLGVLLVWGCNTHRVTPLRARSRWRSCLKHSNPDLNQGVAGLSD